MTATFYDDPNREAIGLPPIWTGAGEAPPEGDAEPVKATAAKGKAKKDTDAE